MNITTIKGMPVIQNQQDFIIGVFKIEQIFKFTRYTKRLIVGFNDDGIPEYNPRIQRNVEPGRVEKIADFLIDDPEATFPTNIVLHIPSQVITYQEKSIDGSFLIVHLNDSVIEGVRKEELSPSTGDIFITIIDGQHRIKGIEVAISRLALEIKTIQKTIPNSLFPDELHQKLALKQKRLKGLLDIDIVVSFFIDKTLEYQAMVFSTINRTQKRVSESLVLSLFGLSTSDSPQKTALQIVLVLNGHPKSPFHNRIKLYGGSYERGQSPPLSQATMVKSIVELISENIRDSERDRFKERKDLRSQLGGKYLPFRIYYANNEDVKISDIFFYFFSAVRNAFSINETSLWDFNPETMSPTNVLQTTVGYQALIKLLLDILQKLKEEERFNFEPYSKYLIKAKSLNFGNQERYPFTSKTKNILYYDMSLAIWPPIQNNDPRVAQLQIELDKL